MSRSFRVLVLGLGLLSGCMGPIDPNEQEPQEQEGLGQSAQALSAENGGNLNGGNLNGGNLNGGNLNGGNLNGGNLNGTDLSQFLVSVSYAGMTKDGAPLEDVRLEGTTFVGAQDNTLVAGDTFLGAQLVGNLGNGDTLPLRITGIVPAAAPNQDLSLYDVEFLGSDNAWHPACRDSTGTPVLALPVQGVWDYHQGVMGGGSKLDDPAHFTFACMGGAIAKCTLWGYRPWETHNGVPLAPYHQACTRLVRADYCGTGESHTKDGTRINLYDSLGIQQDTENWVFEAEWNERGATCFSAFNRAHSLLPCYNQLANVLCGLLPSPRALVRNETPLALPLPL